jgi:hypothetical protein
MPSGCFAKAHHKLDRLFLFSMAIGVPPPFFIQIEGSGISYWFNSQNSLFSDMIILIAASAHFPLHAALRLPEGGYRRSDTPFGICHLFALPAHVVGILFEHFPLDLQPINGHFSTPGHFSRHYNNARIFASSALAAASIRIATSELFSDAADAAPGVHFSISAHNAYLPSTTWCAAVEQAGWKVHIQATPPQADMGELKVEGAAPLAQTLRVVLSLLTLADPEALSWLPLAEYQTLRADAETWLKDAELRATIDHQAQSHMELLYNQAFKFLSEDGDTEQAYDRWLEQVQTYGASAGIFDQSIQEVVRIAENGSHTRIAELLACRTARTRKLLEWPTLERLHLFNPAIHRLQQLATALNASGLTDAQVAKLALIPSLPWLTDARFQQFDLMLWENALHESLPDHLETGLHSLLTDACPLELILTGYDANFWGDFPQTSPIWPRHRPTATEIQQLAHRLGKLYPYRYEFQAWHGTNASGSLLFLRLSRNVPD